MRKLHFGRKKNLILINANSKCVRAVHLKEGVLVDFQMEQNFAPSRVGAIYRARITKKQAGIEACFVDMGKGQSAFLYTGGKNAEEPLKPLSPEQDLPSAKAFFNTLKKGQEVMVQVIKDPLKGKNLRVSCKITLPGVYMVCLPHSPVHIGVSRQITDEDIKRKLISCVQSLNPESACIVRTKAQSAQAEDLKRDWENLQARWKSIQEKYRAQKHLGLIYCDAPFPVRLARDFLTKEVDQVWVDNRETFHFLEEFIEQEMPTVKNKLYLYKNFKVSLFEKYRLEKKLDQLLDRRVRLRSGGDIVIEETEAAVVVDVNTGGFMGKNLPEENILQINKEAAREIASQIRLRNCGGIILIDFIDMEAEDSRQQVMEVLARELDKDRAPTRLFGISELAVAQLTRKRTGASLLERAGRVCPHCEGRGRLRE